jgi:hypothetical protein
LNATTTARVRPFSHEKMSGALSGPFDDRRREAGSVTFGADFT